MKKIILLLILLVFAVLTACDNIVEPSVSPEAVTFQTIEPSATLNPDLEMTVTINPELPDVTLRLTDYVEDGDESGYRMLVIYDTDGNEMNRFAIDEYSDMTKPYSYGLGGITMVDVDFDGYLDVKVSGGVGYADLYELTHFFIWRDGCFVTDPYGLNKLSGAVFDKERQVVTDYYHMHVYGNGFNEYIYSNNRLQMVRCERVSYFYSYSGNGCYVTEKLPELADTDFWIITAHRVVTYDEQRNIMTLSTAELSIEYNDVTRSFNAFSVIANDLIALFYYKWIDTYTLSQFPQCDLEMTVTINPDLPDVTLRLTDWGVDKYSEGYSTLIITDTSGKEIGNFNLLDFEYDVFYTFGANGIHLVDVNFDGYMDIELLMYPAVKRGFYHYFVWEDGRFVNATESLYQYSNAVFDTDRQVITSTWSGSFADGSFAEYKYINGALKMTRLEQYNTFAWNTDEQNAQILKLLPELAEMEGWSITAHSVYTYDESHNDMTFIGEFRISDIDTTYDAYSNIGKKLAKILDWEWTSPDM